MARDQHLIAEPEDLHLSYSCASPVLMAMLVTHDPRRKSIYSIDTINSTMSAVHETLEEGCAVEIEQAGQCLDAERPCVEPVSEKLRSANFGHWHPDRYYDPAAKSEVRALNRAPRRSSGFAVHLASNFYLIGSAENGRAIDFFALRDPMNADFFSISGFNHSTNLDRILFSARTILVKNNDATEKGIMRIRVSDFKQESEGFDVKILETVAGYVCDNTTMIR